MSHNHYQGVVNERFFDAKSRRCANAHKDVAVTPDSNVAQPLSGVWK